MAVKNKKGQLPIDCVGELPVGERGKPSSASPEDMKSLLRMPRDSSATNATIQDGVGGERVRRDDARIEKQQTITNVEIYQVPLPGIPGTLGGVHSIVKIVCIYRNADHFKFKATVWVERVAEGDGGNNVVITREPLVALTLFREAHDTDIKNKLSLFSVLEQAKEWGKIAYSLHEKNCHILAVNLFNFCLKEGSPKIISRRQIPNQIQSWFAATLLGNQGSSSGSLCIGASACCKSPRATGAFCLSTPKPKDRFPTPSVHLT
jgi:hypothetical protein